MDNAVHKTEELSKLLNLVNSSNLSSIKNTLTNLIRVLNDAGSSAKDLRLIIEKDPPLSARILKISNSAFYSYPKEIKSVQEAIIVIGFKAVKELALSQQICALFQSDGSMFNYSRSGLWKHCNAVAICAKILYNKCFNDEGDSAYVSGLLHDIGIIVEDQFCQDDFVRCLKYSEENDCSLLNSENEIFKFNHTDIGYAVAENWDFPEELVMSIGNHQSPTKVEDQFKNLTYVIYIANCLCQKAEIGYCDNYSTNFEAYSECVKYLKIDNNYLDRLGEKVNEEILQMEKSGWI